MNQIPVIIVMVLTLTAVTAMYVSYYIATHKATVVGILKDGILARLDDYGEIVFIGDSEQHKKPSLGDSIRVKHTFALNFKRFFAGEEKKLPGEHKMLGGFETTFWSEELRADFSAATLVSKLSIMRWLAMQGDDEVILELEGGSYKEGDVIAFIPYTVHLDRMYYV